MLQQLTGFYDTRIEVVTMNAHPHPSYAARAGMGLGRAGAANASVWIIRLAILTIVLYFSLIMGALIAALLIIASVLAHADVSNHKKDEYEWRDGLLGYGMYNRDGVRIDPYDPDEEP